MKTIAALVLAAGALVTTAVPAAAHAGNGDVAATHVCIDAAGVYRLADVDVASSCPAGQTAAHLLAPPIAGPQDATGSNTTTTAAGTTNAIGVVGATGDDGAPGPQGPAGDAGPTGPQGPIGPAGLDGVNGLDGADGAAGADGAPGATGETGAVGPQGPVGPAGETGATGAAGAAGATGATGDDGDDGNTILSGGGEPDDDDGVDGDFYLDTASWEIYGPKDDDRWDGPTSLIGDGGDGGAAANTIHNGAGAPSDTDGADGDFYIDTDGWEIYGPKEAGAWTDPTPMTGNGNNGADGVDGADGNTVWNGADNPNTDEPAAAQDGDFYLDIDDWLIYGPRDAGDWGPGASLVGQAANTILHGTGAPGDELGADGDFYIDTTGWDIYGPKATTWPAGEPLGGGVGGADGADGAVGLDGKTVLSGSGVPDNGADGADGDFYIDTDTWNIFGPKTLGVWPAGTALIGQDGEDGNTILNGTDDPNVTPPAGAVDGDFYLDTDDWIAYGPLTAGDWGIGRSLIGTDGTDGAAGAAGAAGADGADGVDGNTIRSGTADPNVTPPAGAVDGDFYIDIDDWVIYGPLAAGDWGAGTALAGGGGGGGGGFTSVVVRTNGYGPTGKEFYVNCLAGEVATGGGFTTGTADNTVKDNNPTIDVTPETSGDGINPATGDVANGWHARVNSNNVTGTVYVICAS